MDRQRLLDTALALVARGKGLLALVVRNKNSWSNFGVKAPGLNDRKASCINLIQRALRSFNRGSFHARNYRKNFCYGPLEAMILKPNMILPGLACPKQETVDEVADATVHCLLQSVPAAVPAIAFLSGGQSCELASARLNAMNVRFKSRAPWALAFSFARAIQQPALQMWQGLNANVDAAQGALYFRATCNRLARSGTYKASMEKKDS